MTDGLRVKWTVDPRYFISLSTIVPCICAIGLLAAPPVVQASEPVTVECSKDAGPQAPRDILKPVAGTNQAKQPFEKAPPATEMNLCNVHFHKYATSSLKKWCADNVFKEDEVHGVRPLVTEANFLSLIQK